MKPTYRSMPSGPGLGSVSLAEFRRSQQAQYGLAKLFFELLNDQNPWSAPYEVAYQVKELYVSLEIREITTGTRQDANNKNKKVLVIDYRSHRDKMTVAGVRASVEEFFGQPAKK